MTSSYFNEWLDEYNDYMRLYMFFGDECYLEHAQETLASLKAIIVRAERHQDIVCKIMSNTVHAY
ncbi:hypothetical protein FHS16_003512 [Paenibacillus endophyticus]|uniref:Uncharacterized protein n=1 Tax=Paenibacillus endophyticus TaxID=1294268 RepID=A0A7W5CA13_9BACL|nr:hypothetical protein [Paenibacillus endophyticus]MBB3153450.1 hypothetical protein [Paenibacillus endophyticus]